MASKGFNFLNFLKKHKSNILFGLVIVLLIIPQTRTPIQVFVQRIISFSPSTVSVEKREKLQDYTWSLKKLNEGTENLEDSKSKVLIVNLWATWCPPCIAEMPSFQSLYDAYGDRVDFYFVSNEKSETLNRFMEKHQYSMPIYQAMEAPPAAMSSNALPTTYVIDKKGEIVIEKTGVADWDSRKMREVLETLLSEDI